jgi:Flp pilus assembly pilin Flp
MKKLELKLTNTSDHNLIDYSLIAGLVAVTAGTVVPGLADSMTPIFSKVGSITIDAFFFLFFNA